MADPHPLHVAYIPSPLLQKKYLGGLQWTLLPYLEEGLIPLIEW